MYRYLVGLAITLFASASFSFGLDDKLRLVIDLYKLSPEFKCEDRLQRHNPELAPVGETIFNSKALSGEFDTSCSDCHIEEFGLSDGLMVSVGVGGEGQSEQRMKSGGVIVPRNSFTFVGRSDRDYKSYFWDGRVELADDGLIYSMFGKDIDKNFDNVLSVAAVLPLLARDEFLGKLRFLEENEHVREINDEYYQDRYLAATELLRKKIYHSDDSDLKKIRGMLIESGIDEDTFRLADVGNSLAAFIAAKFSCKESQWSRYLDGDLQSLTEAQKEGALIFYGAGRCAACHSGSLFTDFKFHSIGSPQGAFGVSALSQDIGRASITHNIGDRYLFRTPSLLNVGETGPYGHSGQFSSLKGIVEFHISPVFFIEAHSWSTNRERYQFGKILSARSKELDLIDVYEEAQVDMLVEFLKAL